jgi:hypothetical protein
MAGYQGIVSEYNQLVQSQIEDARAAADEGISDGLAKQLEAIKEKSDEYAHKFSALAEGGLGEIAGLQGLKTTYKAVQDARAKWRKFRGDGEDERMVGGDSRYLGGDGSADVSELPDDVVGRVRQVLGRTPGSDPLEVGQLQRTGIVTSPEGETRIRSATLQLQREQEEDARRAGAEADEETDVPRGDVGQEEEITIAGERPTEPAEITEDQIDSMVAQARDDIDEGVGRQAAPDTYDVGGVQYGKTGSGADVKSARVSEADQNPTARALPDEPQVAVSQPLASTEPIQVSKIGVKKAAEEFTARADQSAQAVASVQPDDLRSLIRSKYKALSADKQQDISQRVDSGEIDGNDLEAVNRELDKLRPPPAQAAPEPAPAPEPEPAPLPEQEVRVVPRQPQESEGAELTAEERGAIEPEFVQEAPSLSENVAATARSGLRRLLGLGGEEGEVSGLEMLGAAASPVAEAVAVGAGIVSVVDGLVHLFHPKHNAPKPLGHIGVLDPSVNQSLTSKYASAIPTVDTAHEIGGFASF